MDTGTIVCPNCGHQFELSDALTEQVREHLKSELQQGFAGREKELKKKSAELAEEQKQLLSAKESLENQIEKELKRRLVDLQEKATKAAASKFTDELTDLKESLEERDVELKEFKQQELRLRKEQRALQKAKEDAELEMTRRLDDERAVIRKEIEDKAAEQHRLKDLEKDKVINDLKSSLEDMKRKAEQGSTETQGEVLELDFEFQLRNAFSQDNIEPVPKGMRGADLIQRVRTAAGTECGVIVWETKNTKAWGAQWVPKLKDDMIATRASVAILVSVTLPDNVSRFDLVDGVWVTDPISAIPLAGALRLALIDLDRERQASVGKSEKMELLYQYLSGNEFKQKIEGIVDAFTAMQEQVARERRAMEKQWKEREKQIERVVRNTVGLYGEMQGIFGGQIPAIEALELEIGSTKELPASIDTSASGSGD